MVKTETDVVLKYVSPKAKYMALTGSSGKGTHKNSMRVGVWTIVEFAREVGLSRQAVYKHMNQGFCRLDGRPRAEVVPSGRYHIRSQKNPLYKSWLSHRRRNEKYGDREAFHVFVEEYHSGHFKGAGLYRLDPRKPLSPSNHIWCFPGDVAAARMGVSGFSIEEHAFRYGIPYVTVYEQLKKGHCKWPRT